MIESKRKAARTCAQRPCWSRTSHRYREQVTLPAIGLPRNDGAKVVMPK